jgi:hypothetical protein
VKRMGIKQHPYRHGKFVVEEKLEVGLWRPKCVIRRFSHRESRRVDLSWEFEPEFRRQLDRQSVNRYGRHYFMCNSYGDFVSVRILVTAGKPGIHHVYVPLRVIVYLPAGSEPPLSCTPTKCNLHFDISSATVLSKPALYMLLTFHVTNLLSIFCSFNYLSKEFIQVPRPFVTLWKQLIFYGEDLPAPWPTRKPGKHPLSAVHDCLFNTLAATLHTHTLSPLSATWGRAMPWWQGLT